jgi:hypothetical protein
MRPSKALTPFALALVLIVGLLAPGSAAAKQRPQAKQRRAHAHKVSHKHSRPRAKAKSTHQAPGATPASAPSVTAAVSGGAVVAKPTPTPTDAAAPTGNWHAPEAPQPTEPTPIATPTEPTEPSEPTGPAPGSVPLTVGIDGGYSGWWKEEIELRQALDAPVTRHQWEPLEESVDAQDTFMLEATQLVGTRIHAVLGGNDLGDPTAYKEWVIAFIHRYGVGGSFWAEHPSLDESRYAITTFELGNEPYFEIPAQKFAEEIRPTLEAVTALRLPAKLIVPTYTYGSNTSWTDTLYRAIPNLNSLFYAFAEHPYWYGHSPTQADNAASPFERIETLRRDMATHGAAEKPLFITEYGESTADCGSECVDEAEQAEHIQAMLTAVLTHPQWRVEMLIFFQLHDWATSSSDMQQQFGLLRANGTPKPAYPIVQAAMQQYRG